MADESHYSSSPADTHKRKYDDTSPPPPSSTGRRSTGFSAPILSPGPDLAAAVPLSAVNEIELAKQKAQAIAARLLDESEAKRPKNENGGGFGGNQYPYEQKQPLASNFHGGSMGMSRSHEPTSKKIEIPNHRVGVIIGKAGETIKYLQAQSGARIQVTRDTEADLRAPTRSVELMGTADQIERAEGLINEVLAEAEAGGTGSNSRRMTGQVGSEQFVMQVPSNRVGLVIGKGGETIKSIQARTGARVQVIPLHLPPGDTSTERTVQISGTPDQVEAAKQLVNEVTSENRSRGSSMGGGYQQQGYQSQPPTNWTTGPPTQQPSYPYMQPGAYPGPSPQYSTPQANYAGYPPQPTNPYSATWDPTSGQGGQKAAQGNSYNYYNQQPSQQPTSGGPPADNTAYNYSQYPVTTYTQDGYGGGYNAQGSQTGYGSGGYNASGSQAGYGQPPTNPQGYDQQAAYNSAADQGNVTNPPQDGQNPSYGAQGETGQPTQPAQSQAQGQQGYGSVQQPNPAYPGGPGQGSNQYGYAMPPTSQPSYGTQPPSQGGGYGSGYGPPVPAATTAPAYVQTQQSPSQGGGYSQPASVPPAYPYSQPPPAQSGYSQPDAGQRTSAAYGGGSTAPQPGLYPSSYGALPVPPPSYGQQQQQTAYSGSYGASFTQSSAYPADGSSTPATTAQTAANQTNEVAKTSPES